jgi:hypothetical protein
MLAFEEQTHVVRGYLAGEAFYRGRPTSYWRHEFQDWEPWPSASAGGERATGFVHAPTTWGSRLGLDRMGTGFFRTPIVVEISKIMRLHPEDRRAIPVLLALLQDEDANVRCMAVHGLRVAGIADPTVAAALVDCREDKDELVRAEVDDFLKCQKMLNTQERDRPEAPR